MIHEMYNFDEKKKVYLLGLFYLLEYFKLFFKTNKQTNEHLIKKDIEQPHRYLSQNIFQQNLFNKMLEPKKFLKKRKEIKTTI